MGFAKPLLLLGLALLAGWFAWMWARADRRTAGLGGPGARSRVGPIDLAIGFGTDFLDTLGIGSFATTTAAFRLGPGVDDRVLPGTLNVGHALPTIVQALVYVTIVAVDMTTLVAMIGAAVAGGWLGAGVVARWPRSRVRRVMGVALLVAAAIMSASASHRLPVGGHETGIHGWRLAIGVAGNFVLGALMTAGIGLYGPCMILVSLLGLNPTAAFPIMMGSCAFLMPVGSLRFVTRGAYDRRAALGLTLGGIPGVLVAAFLVRSLPLDAVRWLVVGVASYTAVVMLRAARTPH